LTSFSLALSHVTCAARLTTSCASASWQSDCPPPEPSQEEISASYVVGEMSECASRRIACCGSVFRADCLTVIVYRTRRSHATCSNAANWLCDVRTDMRYFGTRYHCEGCVELIPCRHSSGRIGSLACASGLSGENATCVCIRSLSPVPVPAHAHAHAHAHLRTHAHLPTPVANVLRQSSCRVSRRRRPRPVRCPALQSYCALVW
jgi:hypothetical protein